MAQREVLIEWLDRGRKLILTFKEEQLGQPEDVPLRTRPSEHTLVAVGGDLNETVHGVIRALHINARAGVLFMRAPQRRSGFVRSPRVVEVKGMEYCPALHALMGCITALHVDVGEPMALKKVVLSSRNARIPVAVLVSLLNGASSAESVHGLQALQSRHIRWTGSEDELKAVAFFLRRCLQLRFVNIDVLPEDGSVVWLPVLHDCLLLPDIEEVAFGAAASYCNSGALVSGPMSMHLLELIARRSGSLRRVVMTSLFVLDLTQAHRDYNGYHCHVQVMGLTAMVSEEGFTWFLQQMDFDSPRLRLTWQTQIPEFPRGMYLSPKRCVTLHLVTSYPVATSRWVATALRGRQLDRVDLSLLTQRSCKVVKEQIVEQWMDVVACTPQLQRCGLRIGWEMYKTELEKLSSPEMEFVLSWQGEDRTECDFDVCGSSISMMLEKLSRCGMPSRRHGRLIREDANDLSRLNWLVRRYLPASPLVHLYHRNEEAKQSVLPSNVATALPVFYRSYSRRSNANGCYETWNDVVERTLRGMFRCERFTSEQRRLISKQFRKLAALPAGRQLWVAGTSWAENPCNAAGAYNCASFVVSTAERNWEIFVLLMDLAMQGCGTGGVLENLQLLPTVTNELDVYIVHAVPERGREKGRVEETSVMMADWQTVTLTVGDSRKGWVSAYEVILVLSSCTRLSDLEALSCTVFFSPEVRGTERAAGGQCVRVLVDLSYVRPAGMAIKGFGGVANPVGLEKMLVRTAMTLNQCVGRQPNSLEACLLLDFACDCVACGNIRRAAGMRQFSSDDLVGVTAKRNLYFLKDGKWCVDPDREAMRVSNHTRMFHTKPTEGECIQSVASQFESGEGAIEWCGEAERRAGPGGYGMNPCGEILGHNFLCNLAEVHLNRIVPGDLEKEEAAFIAAALMACGQLHDRFENPRIQESRDRDPIIGVSITGLFDSFVLRFGPKWLQWWQNGRPRDATGVVFAREERQCLQRWRKIVERTVAEYCTTYKLKCPNRCTTVQPAGTKSLLTGASPGWHPPKSKCYIRRITFRRGDPIALACMDFGYKVIPSQTDHDEQGRLLDDPFDPRCSEWLVEVPVQVAWADAPCTENIDVEKFSALAQFDFYMQVQRYYTGHNTSGTIELTEEEIIPLGKRIYEAIESDEGYVSVALIGRTLGRDCSFPRMPFEPIGKEEYNRTLTEVTRRRVESDFDAAVRKWCRQASDSSGWEVGDGPPACDADRCLSDRMY